MGSVGQFYGNRNEADPIQERRRPGSKRDIASVKKSIEDQKAASIEPVLERLHEKNKIIVGLVPLTDEELAMVEECWHMLGDVDHSTDKVHKQIFLDAYQSEVPDDAESHVFFNSLESDGDDLVHFPHWEHFCIEMKNAMPGIEGDHLLEEGYTIEQKIKTKKTKPNQNCLILKVNGLSVILFYR